MKTKSTQLLIASALLFGAFAYGASHPELKPFPKAKKGMERFVIVLPEKKRGEDAGFKVELIPGKTMMTDGVNILFMGASLKPKNLQGWGYTYYEIKGGGAVGGTLIGVPPGQPQVELFVRGKPLLIRYNSRLPIVIYAPKGFEIKYRIWSASEKIQKAEQG
ncbi:MAG: ecotin family protein [Opitutales bacterium]